MPTLISGRARLGLRRRPAYAPDAAYGTPEDLKSLIAAATAAELP